MRRAKETDVTVVDFMRGSTGRAARTVVGLAMIAIGLVMGGGWLAVSIVGLVPLAASALGLCLLSPLFNLPLRVTGSPGT
jgi:hypothetical protein